MGYCWTTGNKVNGKWKFLKCDGRSNRCAQDNGVVPNISAAVEHPLCRDCGEYCKTYAIAKSIVVEYDKQMLKREESDE